MARSRFNRRRRQARIAARRKSSRRQSRHHSHGFCRRRACQASLSAEVSRADRWCHPRTAQLLERGRDRFPLRIGQRQSVPFNDLHHPQKECPVSLPTRDGICEFPRRERSQTTAIEKTVPAVKGGLPRRGETPAGRLLTRPGRVGQRRQCPVIGYDQTCPGHALTAEFDPNRTLGHRDQALSNALRR